MLKALIKKQLTETVSVFIKNKAAKKGQKLLMVFVLLAAFLYLGVAVFFMVKELAEICVAINYGWLYFSLLGAFSSLFGTVGSVFTAYSAMFDSKDNDLLLAMPIPPELILAVRMLGVYAMSLLFGSVLYLPAMAAYFYVAGFDACFLLYGLLICIFMPLISTALSCLLGWIVALFLSKLKRKSLFTVVFSLVFLGLYYWSFSYLPEYITGFAAKAEGVADATKSYLYPFYSLGKGATGELLQLLLFILVCVALAVAVYFPLAKSFLKLSTIKSGAAKKAYVSGPLGARSVDRALFSKELARFAGSATYMLNSALGSVLGLVSSVLILIKLEDLRGLFDLIPILDGGASAALIVCALVCFFSGTNMVTACSVSLEGSSLYILQSLPVDTAKVLKAKVALHLTVSLPSALISAVLLCIALGGNAVTYVLSLTVCGLYVLFTAMLGLLINLKFPNLSWKNETVAVKQSLSPLLAMLVSLLALVSLGGACALLLIKDVLTALPLALICMALLAGLDLLCFMLLKSYGTKRFSTL